MSDDSPDRGRRTFLKLVGGACGTAAAAAVGLPVVATVVAPTFDETISGSGGFVPVVNADALPLDGTPIVASVIVQEPIDAWVKMPPTEVGSIFIRRDEAGEVVAYSTICPHLGCQVDLDRSARRMICPCHDSAFSLDGQVTGGPSPRALDRLETRVAGGKVEVRYVRFKTGTHDKIPV